MNILAVALSQCDPMERCSGTNPDTSIFQHEHRGDDGQARGCRVEIKISRRSGNHETGFRTKARLLYVTFEHMEKSLHSACATVGKISPMPKACMYKCTKEPELLTVHLLRRKRDRPRELRTSRCQRQSKAFVPRASARALINPALFRCRVCKAGRDRQRSS